MILTIYCCFISSESTSLLIPIFTLLGIIIGYFYKRREIKYNKQYDSKINALTAFYNSYVYLEVKVRDYWHIVTIFGKNPKGENEVRKIIMELHPLWVDFKIKYLSLRLFLNKNEKANVEKLYVRINDIDEKLRRDEAVSSDEFVKAFNNEFPLIIQSIEDEINKDLVI